MTTGWDPCSFITGCDLVEGAAPETLFSSVRHSNCLPASCEGAHKAQLLECVETNITLVLVEATLEHHTSKTLLGKGAWCFSKQLGLGLGQWLQLEPLTKVGKCGDWAAGNSVCVCVCVCVCVRVCVCVCAHVRSVAQSSTLTVGTKNIQT